MEPRTRRHATQPLGDDERVAVRRVAERLKEAFVPLVESLPGHARGGAGMSRLLGIDRSTCQRIVGALSGVGDITDVLCRAPGVEGFARFIGAMEQRHSTPELLRRARDANGALSALISDLAGSHAGMRPRSKACENRASRPSPS